MEKKCRACLSTTSLFSWNEFVTEKVSYADIFFRVTYFDRQLFPEMAHLCFECGDDIINIYNFIRKATETEVNLKQELYKKSLEKSLKVEKSQNLPDMSEILSQIDTTKVVVKRIDFNELVENEEIRQNPTFLNSLQARFKLGEEDTLDVGNEEGEFMSEDAEYQYVEEEVITDLGFEAVDLDVEIVDEHEENGAFLHGSAGVDFQEEEITLDNDTETHELNDDESSDSKKLKTNGDTATANDCEYCGKTYSTPWSKHNHVLAKHGQQERSLCDECPRTFRDVWTLAKHKKTHDKNRTREYVCTICEMKFLTAGSLKGHSELHDENRVKKFQCDQCDKKFFQKGALNVHRRLHTGQLVQCDWCDKKYPRVVDLDKHLLTHTGELPFSCKLCDKLFKYSSSLYTHMRKEHFGYIYKCSYCSKQFEDKDDLMQHKILHKLTPYRCAICSKEFAKRVRLKHHIKFAHKIEEAQEVDQLIISNQPANKYRRQRKFVNVNYDVI